MPTEATELAHLLTQHRPKPANRGYPSWLRTRVAQHASVRQSEGTPLSVLADELGVARSTLTAWVRTCAAAGRGGFSEVIVSGAPTQARSPSAPAAAPAEHTAIVVTSPHGFNLYGLSLEQALQALMVLR